MSKDHGKRAASMLALAMLATAPSATPSQAAEPVSFGTNWQAQAEHGGFYQALAKGFYAERGLDVEIMQGGPQVNFRQQLAAGQLDFYMGGNKFGQFEFLQQGVPVVSVAAIFQKDPLAFLAHPGTGVDGFDDLGGKTLLLSSFNKLTVWPWLESQFGLQEEQVKPYMFSAAPFLADENTVQQGYVTAEPFVIRREGGFEPVVLLAADAGFDTYSTLIQTTRQMVDEKPEIVQAFVDASILGWVDYLYGDPSPGNALILEHNPEMTEENIAYSIQAMKDYGIVDSGDARTLGIGAMTDDRWQGFFEKAVAWGTVDADLPYREGYTLAFVNQGVGVDRLP